MPKAQNYRDVAGPKLATWRRSLVEGLERMLGDPPAAVVARSQKDDDHDAYWTLGDGWPEDAAGQAAKEAAMYAQGAEPADVLKVKHPMRVKLIPYGDRADDIEAQAEFCREMVVRHMEILADEAVALRDSMREGEDGGPSGY